MKRSARLRSAISGLALLCFAFPRGGDAHRLDEYLQATRISIELDRIEVEMNLTPGAAVADAVFAAIDVDHNGAISPAEGTVYAKLVIRSLSLSVDGHQRALTLDGCTLPPLADMRNGVGIIRLRASAKTPRTAAGQHNLAFANRHRSDIGVYLINALIPADERIRITAQSRDTLQNEFKMEFKVNER